MRKKLMIAVAGFASFGFAVQADQPAVKAPEQGTQQPGASAANADQAQIEVWKIETGKVAKDYVEGLDKGDYAQSWPKGDQLFQHTITQKEWEKALTDNRKKLGSVKSRTVKDQKPAWDPHGLPKGAYMVVEYNTAFENAPDSGELLTLRRGSDGTWRVLTYQVN